MRYILPYCFMFLTLTTDFLANAAPRTAHLSLLLAIVSISVIAILFLLKKMQSLKKENMLIADEQQQLIKELDQTMTALEDYKEVTVQQQGSMKRIAMVLSHDLQSPFRFLVSSSETLYQSITEKEEDNAAILSLEIRNSGEKMLNFLTDFTIWIKSISEGYQLKQEKVNPADMFSKIACFFSEQLKRKRNALSYEVIEDITIITDKELLKIILRNIVDNANKYNTDCIIKLEARQEAGFGTIVITDNGRGIAAPVLERIKDVLRHEIVCVTDTDDKQGYKFIAHFSGLLNIETNIYSEPGKGTCIRLENLNIA